MATERMQVARLPPIESLQMQPTQQISPRHGQKYIGLTGPSYTIGGQPVKYNLPSPGVLRPHQDTKAGMLDTWPAHATAQASSSASVMVTKDKQLRVIDDEAMGKTSMVPKPKFLERLENFLKKELKALGVAAVGPSELRLQAHREVFEYLVEDFKTYKPLLSSIKNEYEMMLAYQREQIRQMEPLKQMLVTVSEQCDQKIMSLRDEEKQENKDLKEENKRLYRRIDELRQEQVALETQVEKLQEELAAEYLRYRDECDARKMLVADINDLRYQQEDMLVSKQSMEELEEEKDDPITLKIALRKAREDEAAATTRLHEMEANYGDVIPRRDNEALQKKHEELNQKYELIKSDMQKLKDEHDVLLEANSVVVKQRDEFYVEAENLRRSATPRPEWGRCADHVTGGSMRWTELSDGKTSDQLVGVLLQEIAGGAGSDAAGAEYFDGQGTGPEIPKYLQYEGKVRNRRLGKRDTALLIRDIWREKATQDAESPDGVRSKLSEFLYDYLQRRFALEQMVIEWGYNLHDACQRYSHDDNIGLFWAVLTDEADEQLYIDELALNQRLLSRLTKLDYDKGNQGTLTKEDFKSELGEFFSGRDEENISALVRAAETELDAKESETLDYKNLFWPDDEGKYGPFLEEVKQQEKAERQTYIDDIKVQLGESSQVSVEELKTALTCTDPAIDIPDMERYLSWAFRTDTENLQDAAPVEQSALLQRLLYGNIKRIGERQ